MYTDLIFLPLALPSLYFEREPLLAWFDSRKTRGMEEYVAEIGYPWNVVWLKHEQYQPELLESPIHNLSTVLGTLPHRSIRRVYLLEQLIEVPHHRDVSREDKPELGPSTYRNMLINDAPESTFYYLRGTKKAGNLEPTPIYPVLPEKISWFAHNNFASHHGSFMPPEGARKLILCVWGEVDPHRHMGLLAKSAQSYWEYRIA